MSSNCLAVYKALTCLGALAIISLVSFGQDHAGLGIQPDKGTKAWAIQLGKGEVCPEGIVPGKLIDIVGELDEPVKTSIGLLKVKLLAVDSSTVGREVPQTVQVQLTPIQVDVARIMVKHGVRISVRKTGNKIAEKGP